ncbi:MAG: dihydrodipicolinate synthase family protein, partial [Rhodoferax sp.]
MTALLAQGAVIPAHPLALDSQRRFDRQRQRALTRYYVDAGAGGLAVGVHTTQFSIRERGLYELVLRCAMEDRLAWTNRPMAMIAGLCGSTSQARNEAQMAVS